MNLWHDSKGLATGYYIHFFRSAFLHGLLRGTNSFTFPYSSQAEVLQGFFMVGLWETLALSLICAAIAPLARYSTNSAEAFVGFIKFITKPATYLERHNLAVLLVGLLLLVLAAVMEGINILF